MGQTLNLGFNPKFAKFLEVNGDLIAVHPKGVVILEGFKSALLSDTPPKLLYHGMELAAGEFLTTSNSEFQLAPAGEPQAPRQTLVGGGTSAYGEYLGLGIGELDAINVGGQFNSTEVDGSSYSTR